MAGSFEVFAPGHLALFGDPGLPGNSSIVQAIDRGVRLRVTPRRVSNSFEIAMPFFGVRTSIPVDGSDSPSQSSHLPDEFRGVVQELVREGASWKEGASLQFESDLPFGAYGVSGAAAVAFTRALVELAGASSARFVEPRRLAEVAARPQTRLRKALQGRIGELSGNGPSSVDESREGTPRGFDDPPWTNSDTIDESALLASALGGLHHLNFGATPFVHELPAELEGLVLIEDEATEVAPHASCESVLVRRLAVFRAIGELKAQQPELDLDTVTYEEVWNVLVDVAANAGDAGAAATRERLVFAALFGRDLLHGALRVLTEKPVDLARLGELLDEHHSRMRDDFDASTPRVEQLRQAALAAGALGVKVESHGSERLFALAPGRTEQVRASVALLGADGRVVRPGAGVRLTPID